MQKNSKSFLTIDCSTISKRNRSFYFSLSALLMSAFSFQLGAQQDMEEWEFNAEYPNKIVIGAGGVNVNGDDAQFLQRVGLGDSFYGGLESLEYKSEIGEGLMLELEAKAIPGIEDYLARVRLTKEDVGYLEFGYQSYRNFYDATAGYDPVSGYSYTYFDESLYVDRSKLWVAAHWANGSGTQLDAKYTRSVRNGKKGTTSWADGTSPLGGRLNIIPGFYDIDEVKNTIEVDFSHENESMALELGAIFENNDQNNSRNFRRQPENSADRYFMQVEKFETDMFNGHGSLSYKVNEKVRLNVGSAYTKLDTILNGSRTINGEFSPIFDPDFFRQNRDHGFLDLDGETNIKQWIMNANVEILATETLQIVPSIKVENYDTDSFADVLETNANGRGVDSFEELQPFGNSYWDDVSAQIEVVYRGIPKWVLSAELFGSRGEGDLAEREIDVETSSVVMDRDTKRERDENKISVSAKFYPQPGLNFVFNAYHKNGENDFKHIEDVSASASAELEEMDFQTNDVNFRISWKPTAQLSLVSRVDYQQSSIGRRAPGLAMVDNAEMETLIFSEAFTLIPNEKFMLQGSLNFVTDTFGTPTDELNGVSPQLVPDMHNDYWQVDLTATFNLSATRSLMIRGFRYESDGYTHNADVTVPYGYTDKQTSLTITGRQKIDDFTTVSLQYGYYDLGELTSGGRNDYDAHVIYCRWERQF